MEKELLSFGVGLLGSLVSGKLGKKTKLARDTIPTGNAVLWGGGVGAVTKDPESALAATLGAVIATALHQLFKLFRKK